MSVLFSCIKRIANHAYEISIRIFEKKKGLNVNIPTKLAVETSSNRFQNELFSPLTPKVKHWVMQSFVTFDSKDRTLKCDHSLESC